MPLQCKNRSQLRPRGARTRLAQFRRYLLAGNNLMVFRRLSGPDVDLLGHLRLISCRQVLSTAHPTITQPARRFPSSRTSSSKGAGKKWRSSSIANANQLAYPRMPTLRGLLITTAALLHVVIVASDSGMITRILFILTLSTTTIKENPCSRDHSLPSSAGYGRW